MTKHAAISGEGITKLVGHQGNGVGKAAQQIEHQEGIACDSGKGRCQILVHRAIPTAVENLLPQKSMSGTRYPGYADSFEWKLNFQFLFLFFATCYCNLQFAFLFFSIDRST